MSGVSVEIGPDGRIRVSTGSPWEPVVGYSRAVRVGQQVWVAGTTAVGPDGRALHVGDAGAQAEAVLARIVAALGAVGATPDDVVRTRMYVVDITAWEAIGRAHGAVFGRARPAATMVEVSRLVDPELLVEIEVDAVVPEGR